MIRTLITAGVAALAIGLAACGGTASTTHHAASPAPSSTIGYADAGRAYAALNALEYGGSSKAAAAATVEAAEHLTAADIARARQLRCPGN